VPVALTFFAAVPRMVAALDATTGGPAVLSSFFIGRPIFATVIAIAIVLVGAVSLPFLPIAQYPPIAPPTVAVSATFTGASASVVEASVTTPLEEQINGVEGMVYMSSVSADDGTVTITVIFETGYDLDIAAVDVQNRVEVAASQLPEEVVQAGITVTKQSSDLTVVPSLYSPDGRYDTLFISNYVNIHVVDVLSRIPGVGDVTIFGERKFAMRIWLDPQRMASLGITVEDVASAIAEQNQVVAAGALGEPPAPQGQVFQFTLTAMGRLESAEQFADIVIRADPDGKIVRIRDIGRVELGAEVYDEIANVSGEPALPIGLMQLANANAIELADRVVAEMDRLSTRFPEGLEYEVIYDTTRFVRESIKEVLTTLAIAIALVVFVIFVFLHGIRTTLIPVITIPVCLVGTLAALLAFGFSINTLTLFGMVLAVGLVVDDAIVVERGAPFGDRGRRAAGRGGKRHETGHRADYRDVAGADGGVHPGRLYARDYRQALRAVCSYDCLRRRHLRLQLAELEPGPLRRPAARRRQDAPRTCRSVRCRLHPTQRRLRAAGRIPGATLVHRRRPLRRGARRHGLPLQGSADRLRAAGRSRLFHCPG